MVKDIIKASLQLSKKDKVLLVNEVLASMSSKQGRAMPVSPSGILTAKACCATM